MKTARSRLRPVRRATFCGPAGRAAPPGLSPTSQAGERGQELLRDLSVTITSPAITTNSTMGSAT